MGQSVVNEQSRLLVRLAAVSLVAGVAAGCSSDVMRFTDDPFSNPFKDPGVTGSIQPSPPAPVASQPLSSPAVASTYRPAQSVQQAAYATPQPARATSAPPPVTGSANGWTAQGGTPIYVGTGDTLASISGRYGVPMAAILGANGLTSASQITPGRQIVIPVYNPGASSVAAAPQPVKVAAAGNSVPAPAPAPVPPRASRPVVQAAPQSAPSRPAEKPVQVAKLEPKAEPAKQEVKAAPAPAPVEAAKPAEKAPEPTRTASLNPSEVAGGLEFRWPARGRVIAGFGGNGGNEGINIAVPEGTPVKAAESGTVAYAGNELKGYGNLILIRHDNGWVSAYAHNSELLVKRGDTVRRGQTIAKSGQTGNVSSPQLHFELRRGSSPVDPMPYLAGL